MTKVYCVFEYGLNDGDMLCGIYTELQLLYNDFNGYQIAVELNSTTTDWKVLGYILENNYID